MRLQRKEKTRSGIQRAPARDFPMHRRHVRRYVCEFCGGSAMIECAHLHLETDGGMGIKPHDAWTFPACHDCHVNWQHRIGEPRAWAAVGKDPHKTCLKYARTSPVEEVRDYARDVMIPTIERFTEYDARIAALANQEAA